MTTTERQTLTIDVVTDLDGFRALEDEWRDLYDDCPRATPFQTWEWLYTWWEVYGTPDALRLVTARSGGRLRGVMPLMTVGRGRLQFVGTGLSDHLDVLVDPAWADAVVTAWADRLYRGRGLRLLDLHEVRPAAAVWALYERWPGPATSHVQSECAEFDVLLDADFDEQIRRWSANTRQKIRRTVRRFAREGYVHHWARPDEIGDLAEELVRRHQRMWEGRGITPAHADPRFVRFVRTAAERMAPHGAVAIVRLVPPPDAEDPMELCDMLVVGHEYVGGWLSAHNEAARRRITVAIAEDLHGIELAQRAGVRVMSTLRGLEAGKLHMRDRILSNQRLLLGGGTAGARAVWLAAAAPLAAVAGLKRWERDSERGRRATALLRSLRDRVRR